MKRIVFIFLLAVALLIALGGLRQLTIDSNFDKVGFSELPVQVGGRIKPIDSVARNGLLILSARQKVVIETESGETTLSPIEWFMDLAMRPEVADDYPVFKIEFPDDLGLAGLKKAGRYYSFNELLPYSAELRRLYSELNPEVELRSPYEKQIADLNEGLLLYSRLMHSLHPMGSGERLDRLVDEYATFQALAPDGRLALERQQSGEEYDAAILQRFIVFLDDYVDLSKRAYFRAIPPAQAIDDQMVDWSNIGSELLDVTSGAALSPYAVDYATLTMAYRQEDPKQFNQTLTEMQNRYARAFPNATGRVAFERGFNAYQPFYICMQLYVFAFLIICFSWLVWPKSLRSAALLTVILAFVIHTLGLIARMYIQGRPPITNLYSSAVFVGWGAVLLGIFLEKGFKNGVGAAMASLIGFCTLIIAHHLAMTGDTLEMMRAVLDSNFWLATHVIIITFGYSAVFLAGGLAIAFTISGLLSRRFDNQAARSLSSMVYGITAFGVLFSLVGTILGGIWADQSWGRFWGWDPKENGALMIVIMGAIYLHARWGGICKERGLMALAICGNIITAWSWFGTNMLPVGLHSYGRMDSAYKWLLIFVLSQLIMIALTLLPWKFWRSDFGYSQYNKSRKRILIADR